MGICWCCLGAESSSLPKRVVSVQPPKGILVHLEIKGGGSTIEDIMQYMFDGWCTFMMLSLLCVVLCCGSKARH